MSEQVGRARVALSLLRQYGTAHCVYRAWHLAARRSGWLKRRFPTPAWDALDRRRYFVEGAPGHPASWLAARRATPPPFFFTPGRLPELPHDWTAGAVVEADGILAGRLRYFSGETASIGFPFDWMGNPFTGERADAVRHWCDRDDFEPGQGDIRILWEPSRFNWVYTLVRAYAATGDERYAKGFWDLVASWRDANPVNRGPNWQCGQECALRAMALCFGLHGFLVSTEATPERAADLTLLLALHGERIAANLHFARTQMGNHAVSEAAALYTLGVFLPDLRWAGVWRRRGLAVLEDEVRRHNRDDGSYIQHSMNYHRLMLHNYLWVLRLAELNGDRFDGDTLGRLERATDFLHALQDPPSGRVPNYGPNDGSLILPLNACDFLDYRPIVAAMHFALHRRRLYPEGPWEEDIHWLYRGGPGGAAIDARPRPTARFDDGGYYALRGRESWGMVRCHSFRTRPNQADLLHLDLWWRGINLLRDSGTFSYNAPDPWRDLFLSTSAHNTVEVALADQMVRVRRFTWVHLAASRLRYFVADPQAEVDYFEGEHHGYRRLPGHVVHRRAILRLGEALWVVVDDLLGQGMQRLRLMWHLADMPVTQAPGHIEITTAAGRAVIGVWTREGIATPALSRGAEGPPPIGWSSERYNVRHAAPTACLDTSAVLPWRAVTLIRLGVDAVSTADADLRGMTIAMGQGEDAGVRLLPCRQDAARVVEEVRWRGRRIRPVADTTRGGGEHLHA